MDTQSKRKELVAGLKNYFNGDMARVKRFGIQLKALGFDLNDYNTLCQLEARGEALIILLGLSNFGVLNTVCETIMYLRGHTDTDEYIKEYGDRIKSMPPPR